MKLWTKALENRAKKFPLGSQDGKHKDATVLVKYFLPGTAATWIVTEASPLEDGDWEFFGFVCIFSYDEWEWGYFTLHQLEELKAGFFSVEREINTPQNATVKDLIKR